MGNKRTEIRQALKTLISADSAFDNVTVFSSRRSNVSQIEQLPSITIQTPNEDSTPETLQFKRYIRKIELRLEIRISATDDADDVLDTLMAQVEDFMLLNQSVSGNLLSCYLLSSEIDVAPDGNEEIGLGTLIYQGTYVS